MALKAKLDSLTVDNKGIVHVKFTDINGKKQGVGMSMDQFIREMNRLDLKASYEFVKGVDDKRYYMYIETTI